MTDVWTRLCGIVEEDGKAALVTVLAIRGSAPREAGARMVVSADNRFAGTIGGGQLEWEAIQLAAGRLRGGATTLCLTDFALGPDLGQCCGGRVEIAVEMYARADLPEIRTYSGLEASGGFSCETRFDETQSHAGRRLSEEPPPDDEGIIALDPSTRLYRETFTDARQSVLLFGAGHVGRAVVLALAPLPFRVTWVDGRADAFPKTTPRNVSAVRAQKPAGLVADAPAGAFVLIMTHSHPLDLELARAALARSDLPYVGVIGSDTKRARFLKRLAESGLDATALRRFRCPIGIDGIDDKAPSVIAASVAAELLLTRQTLTKVAVDKTAAEDAYR